MRENAAADYTTDEDLYQDNMEEDWSEDNIPHKPSPDQKERLTSEKQPVESVMLITDIVVPEKPTSGDETVQKSEKQVTNVGEHKEELGEYDAGECITKDEIYVDYLEDWSPDVIPQKPVELIAQVVDVIEAEKQKERIPGVVESAEPESWLSEQEKPVQELICTRESDIAEDYFQEEWSADVILNRPEMSESKNELDKPSSQRKSVDPVKQKVNLAGGEKLTTEQESLKAAIQITDIVEPDLKRTGETREGSYT